jgi:hypothetical protein
MQAKSRIYKVTNELSGDVRLIEGQSQAQVARYILANEYTIAACAGMDGIRLAADGVRLESAMLRYEEDV